MTKNKIIYIGITSTERTDRYLNYEKFIRNRSFGYVPSMGQIETIELSYKKKNLKDLHKCKGLILSGGADVHPQFYHKKELLSLCKVLHPERDEFEFLVIEQAEKLHIPILGICRGLQIYNVYKKGTLIPDLPNYGKFNHSLIQEKNMKYHSVSIDKNATLYQLFKKKKLSINSSHHQAIDRVGEGLVSSAISSDGVVEAVEQREQKKDNFILMLQWHPEMMPYKQYPSVAQIKQSFLEASSK